MHDQKAKRVNYLWLLVANIVMAQAIANVFPQRRLKSQWTFVQQPRLSCKLHQPVSEWGWASFCQPFRQRNQFKPTAIPNSAMSMARRFISALRRRAGSLDIPVISCMNNAPLPVMMTTSKRRMRGMHLMPYNKGIFKYSI